MYSAAVLDHFKNPRNAGEMPDATAQVEVTNPVCGDILQLAVRVEKERIVEVRFKAQGCVTAIACSSLLTEWMKDRTLGELRAVTPENISDALGGLPPTTFHGCQLACDALAAMLKSISRSGSGSR